MIRDEPDLNITRMLFRLEDIVDRLKEACDQLVMSGSVDEVIDDLTDLYDDLKLYTDITVNGVENYEEDL